MGEPLQPIMFYPFSHRVMRYMVLLVTLVIGFTSHAQSRQDSLMSVIQSLNESEELADTYYELYKTYEGTDLKMAGLWIDKLEALSEKLNYRKGAFNALKARGKVFYFDKNPDSALVYFQKAFDENLDITTLDSADLYNQMGVSYESKGEIDLALKHLNQALKIYDRVESDRGLLAILVNMGNCFYEAGNAEQALEYLKRAYELALELKDEKNIAITILNYAMFSLYVEGDTDKIDRLMAQLKDNPVLRNNPDLMAAYYQNMAVFYTQSDMLEEAEDYYRRALEHSRTYSEKDPPGIYIGLAQLYVKKGALSQAKEYYNEALQRVSKKSDQRLVSSDMARLYVRENNIDSASFYWEKSYQLMEEIQEERLRELVRESKYNIDLIQKENEIAILQEQHKRNLLQKQIDRNTIVGLVVGIILLVMIALLFVRQKRKQLQAKERELALKNQNLVNLSLHINQKNQLLKDFESSLAQNEKEANNDDLYKAAKRALKDSLRVDEDWKEFELYFNDLYSGFYDKLKNDFPDLTNNELRVCSLAKLRLSLKEIAQILFLSVDSVKSARYRIRKKLNLETNEDLSDFLNKL